MNFVLVDLLAAKVKSARYSSVNEVDDIATNLEEIDKICFKR